MSRGNQREKDRLKKQKMQGNKGEANTMSGPAQARAKEEAAAIMRKKQAAADAKKSGEGSGKK